MKNKYRYFYVILTAVITALILNYAEGFLFSGSSNPPSKGNTPEDGTQDLQAVEYRHMETVINGYVQKINMLTVDLRNRNVTVKPALSHGEVYGFELLSKIAERHNAFAAVNAGFFYEYGNPSGMVLIDGKLISASTGKYPVFILKDGMAEMREVYQELWIEHGGKRLDIDNINVPGTEGSIVLYTPEYGKSSRTEGENTAVVIEDGRVKNVSAFSGDIPIPQKGMLLLFYGGKNPDAAASFHEGESVEFFYSGVPSGTQQAYECGSWIVRDGEVAVKDWDEWVGIMTNRDPRTVIGLKDGHTVVLLTVDGRQPGYSQGLTAKELAGLLLSYGIDNAAMLDGGASTEMIVDGRIVNRPSYKGTERPVGGGLIVLK